MKEQSITNKRFVLKTHGTISSNDIIFDSDRCEYIVSLPMACRALNEINRLLELSEKSYAELESKLADEDLCTMAEECYGELLKRVESLSKDVDKLIESQKTKTTLNNIFRD